MQQDINNLLTIEKMILNYWRDSEKAQIFLKEVPHILERIQKHFDKVWTPLTAYQQLIKNWLDLPG